MAKDEHKMSPGDGQPCDLLTVSNKYLGLDAKNTRRVRSLIRQHGAEYLDYGNNDWRMTQGQIAQLMEKMKRCPSSSNDNVANAASGTSRAPSGMASKSSKWQSTARAQVAAKRQRHIVVAKKQGSNKN